MHINTESVPWEQTYPLKATRQCLPLERLALLPWHALRTHKFLHRFPLSLLDCPTSGQYYNIFSISPDRSMQSTWLCLGGELEPFCASFPARKKNHIAKHPCVYNINTPAGLVVSTAVGTCSTGMGKSLHQYTCSLEGAQYDQIGKLEYICTIDSRSSSLCKFANFHKASSLSGSSRSKGMSSSI